MSTFIIFGNLEKDFDRMVSITIKNIDILPTPIYIQAGYNFKKFMKLKKKPNKLFIFDFCSAKKFNTLIHISSVIITHCGVGSIKKSIDSGKFPAFFVRNKSLGEHVDDHQAEFASVISPYNTAFEINSATDLTTFIKDKIYIKKPNKKVLSLFNTDAIANDIYEYIQTFV
jgi:UDP-N-acetylglucosamine transferase subunit ALG13